MIKNFITCLFMISLSACSVASRTDSGCGCSTCSKESSSYNHSKKGELTCPHSKDGDKKSCAHKDDNKSCTKKEVYKDSDKK